MLTPEAIKKKKKNVPCKSVKLGYYIYHGDKYVLTYETDNLEEAKLERLKLKDQGYNTRLDSFDPKSYTKPYKIFTYKTRNSVFKDKSFMRNNHKFILHSRFHNLKVAEIEVEKLEKEGYIIILNKYAPQLHYEPYVIFKGPKRNRSKKVKKEEGEK